MNALTQGGFLLPLILGIPLLGAIFVMCTPKTEGPLHRGIGLFFSAITFFVSLAVFKYFDAKQPGFQLVFDVNWIPALGTHPLGTT